MLLSGILIASMAHLVVSSCPCTVDDETTDVVLSCSPNSIHNFPADLIDCNFEGQEIDSIQLFQQPLKQLQDRAFADFPNLKELGIAYCKELSVLSPSVFEGVPELNGLYIERTNLTYIPAGALDNLTRLRYLYLPHNTIVQPYVAQAWHFCRRLEADKYYLNIEGDIEIEKYLTYSSTTNEYCSWRQRMGDFSPSVSEKCTKDVNNTYTCDGTNMEALACELEETNFENIIFEFPSSPDVVQNFYEAETNTFFQQFNYRPDHEDYAKVMTIQQLYGTKLDLSDVLRYTSTKTEKIYIHADTVYMSQPITEPIHFDIIIRSRRASIDFPIPMKYTKDQLFDGYTSNTAENNDVERWALKEDHIRMSDELVVRVRKLGRVEVLDALPNAFINDVSHRCIPYLVNVTKYGGDISSWYDVTSINLNYVGARTLQAAQKDNLQAMNLLNDMTHFQLNYVNDASVVGKPRAFIAAQKYIAIEQTMKFPNSHNVPRYSLNTIKELANVMYDRLAQYRATEIQTEDEMSIAQARVRDMQLQFDIVEAQQQLYIHTEMEILDAIFTSVNESWHWSFEHRETIKKATDEAFQLIMDNIFDMQEEEYQHMLSQAEDAKQHYEATVDKYETQVQRYLEAADALMDYQMFLMDEMNTDTERLNQQIEIFEKNVEKWKRQQEAKASHGLIKGIFELGRGIVEGYVCPECMADAVKEAMQGLKDIAGAMAALTEVVETVDSIMAALEELDGIPLEDMALNLTLNYKDSLTNAINMKESAPMFEDIQNMADITLQDLKEAIPEIEGTADLQVACKKVTQCGFRLIDAVSDFADKMLQLAERQDELIVAQQDLERATAQVLIRNWQKLCTIL